MQTWDLDHQRHAKIHDGADGSKVVQRDQRIHLVLGRAQQSLHHDQSNGLENNAATLEDETDENELDFPKGSDYDTEHDKGDVEEDFHVRWRNTETPCDEEDNDRHRSLRCTVRDHCPNRYTEGTTNLQHLDKGHAQV